MLYLHFHSVIYFYFLWYFLFHYYVELCFLLSVCLEISCCLLLLISSFIWLWSDNTVYDLNSFKFVQVCFIGSFLSIWKIMCILLLLSTEFYIWKLDSIGCIFWSFFSYGSISFWRQAFKALIVILDISVSTLSSINFCFMCCEVLFFNVHTFIIAKYSWWIDPLSLCNIPVCSNFLCSSGYFIWY